jgi:hypothetical protein
MNGTKRSAEAVGNIKKQRKDLTSYIFKEDLSTPLRGVGTRSDVRPNLL